jgi:hypothetical protein
MKRLLFAMLAVVTITVAFGGIAHARPGTNNPATPCQTGGWQSLPQGKTGLFTNQGDCVSYAAHSGFCLDGIGIFPDARLTGAMDTFHNGTGYSSQDGTCTGTITGYSTVVSAADAPTARDLCLKLDSRTDGVQHLVDWYAAAPADWWLCLIPA